MNKSIKAHMNRAAELPCGICGAMPVELHHVLEGRTPGRRSPDMLVIPLCTDCHRGDANGIHGSKVLWNVYRKNELDVLAETLERIYG